MHLLVVMSTQIIDTFWRIGIEPFKTRVYAKETTHG